jgi:hypothetical protein
MRSISIHEVTEIDDEGESYVSGFMAHIEPPVVLNPAAVELYIRDGQLSPLGYEATTALANPMLIGNGENHTAIYASPEIGHDDETVKQLFASRVAGLIGHLGIEAEIM